MKPLRKIVGRKIEKDWLGLKVDMPVEILECGHTQPPITDFYGETNAVRRRCRKCPDIPPKKERT